MDAHNRIIVACDVPAVATAKSLLEQLQGHVGMAKVGLQLFISGGRGGLREILGLMPIMLDLKLHDIPATMTKAFIEAAAVNQEAVRNRVEFLTLHTAAGPKALQACRQAANELKEKTGFAPALLGVTVLTSLGDTDLNLIGVEPRTCKVSAVQQTVLQRAALAMDCGLDGLVCSGWEASLIRKQFGKDLTLVVPGIRPAGSHTDDQVRVMTPAKAIVAGADYLVVGRSITGAEVPVASADRIAKEIQGAYE